MLQSVCSWTCPDTLLALGREIDLPGFPVHHLWHSCRPDHVWGSSGKLALPSVSRTFPVHLLAASMACCCDRHSSVLGPRPLGGGDAADTNWMKLSNAAGNHTMDDDCQRA